MFPTKTPVIPAKSSVGTGIQLGNGSGGFAEATLGSGLILLGTTLSSTGGGSSPTDAIDLYNAGYCIGDGTTNDDAGFDAALATGRPIYLTAKKSFKLATAKNLPYLATIFGANNISSEILWSNATDYCFNSVTSSSQNYLHDFLVAQDPAVTPSAGGAFLSGHATLIPTSNLLSNLVAFKTYNGFAWNGRNQSHYAIYCQALLNVGTGFLVNCPTGYSFGTCNLTVSYNTGANPTSRGIWIQQTDVYHMIHHRGFYSRIHINGSTGHASSGGWVRLSLEGVPSGVYAITVGDGSYAVDKTVFSNIELFNTGDTMLFGVHASNTRVHMGKMEGGKIADYGSNTALKDLTISGNVELHSTGSRFESNTMSGGGTSFTTYSGCTSPIIVNNTFGATPIIHANSWNANIRNNIGFPDILTSISSAPNFVGQLALVGGLYYMARGTSSTADWGTGY